MRLAATPKKSYNNLTPTKEQVAVRVERVGFRRLRDAVNDGADPCAAGRIGEQEILPPHHKRLDTPFGAVVADFEASVQQIIGQRRPLVGKIGERLPQFGLRRDRPGVGSRPELVQKRLLPL